MVEFENDIGIHLDEAAIAVPCEARIARRGSETFNRSIVQAKVEDGVHHPGHRYTRTGTDRNKQRVGRITKALAGYLFNMRDAACDFSADAFRKGLAIGIIGRAHFGRDGEARRDRQAD